VSASATHRVVLIPHHRDPLEALAHHVLEHHGAQLPDLSRLTVLLPDPGLAPRLRGQLLALAAPTNTALLGPRITTPLEWGLEHAPGPLPDEQRRALMLFEALRDHPGPFAEASHWHLVEELIALFDDLTLDRAPIPEEAGAFRRLIGHAYGLERDAPSALDAEADLVHQLWRAWHRQHAEEGLHELQSAYLEGLACALDALGPDEQLCVAGMEQGSRGEAAWARALGDTDRATLFVHATRPRRAPGFADSHLGRLCQGLGIGEAEDGAATPRAHLLEELFDRADIDLAARALRCRAALSESPLEGAVRVAIADDLEQEAALIDVQVRLWLTDGRGRIGIVTEDRRLGRRLRALLERSGIRIEDGGGWALSTTSAAAALERWLECIEEDFAHQALLDVLKSPFVFAEPERESHLRTVHRLEQDVIHHEAVARGLRRYRAAVLRRQDRLKAERSAYPERILALLDALEYAAAPLSRLAKGRREPAGEYLAALLESLNRLGLTAGFTTDAAGQRLLDVLERMTAAAEATRPRLSWTEFRAWLGRNLERHYFRPLTDQGAIELTDARHSRLQRFDALILARLDARHFPGPAEGGSFFNDAVRAQLGLATWQDRLTERLADFRRLLEAAPRILLTTARGDADRELRPSPWLELLEVFHRLAYGSDLRDDTLRRLAEHPDARPFEGDTREPPPVPTRPAPAIPEARVPQELSVSAHQTLIDCPYQFYARYCLGLRPPEEISEALSKADYGMLIHRCLQALHTDLPGLPGPYTGAWTSAQRGQAIALLEAISARVFHTALEDSFEHRGWLERWRAMIPAYIDWETARQAQAGTVSTEQVLSRELAEGLTLHGRLDRVERGPEGTRIVDYKTGGDQSRKRVLRGDDVQIASYALLAPEAREAEYLKIDQRRVGSTAAVADQELRVLSERVGERLRTLHASLRNGAGAPANGEEQTCRYCDMAGLCRRAVWRAAPSDIHHLTSTEEKMP
jgi:ATP-dependent helicase/nuclease subunit B